MMLGSIPQQDVFQRVMSANSVKRRRAAPVIGGVCYILFAFVPMFLVASALIIMPEQTDGRCSRTIRRGCCRRWC